MAQLQDLSVRKSAVLIEGVRNGRSRSELLALVVLVVQRIYEDRKELSGPLSVLEALRNWANSVCQERRLVDLVS
jgi:hypothetical protein